ncbi:hypothetical protein [Caulobacter sp. BP25]|uniref:hypothetical protein n=1 Tax=Caulobacter sp. BP25 TaxID=2048900 RepID=UPI003513977E
MTAQDTPELSNRVIAARIWREYLQPRRNRLVAALLCAVAVAGLSAALAYVLKPAVDHLISDPQPGALWRIPLLIALIAVSRGSSRSCRPPRSTGLATASSATCSCGCSPS